MRATADRPKFLTIGDGKTCVFNYVTTFRWTKLAASPLRRLFAELSLKGLLE
jgi:hypothetical protein